MTLSEVKEIGAHHVVIRKKILLKLDRKETNFY